MRDARAIPWQVIKLTGKYVLPGLAEAVRRIPLHAAVAIQHNRGPGVSMGALPGDDEAADKALGFKPVLGCGLTCSELYVMTPQMMSEFVGFVPTLLPDLMNRHDAHDTWVRQGAQS